MRSLRTSGYQNGSWTLHAPCHERLVTWPQQREDATIFLSACTPLELLFAPQDQLHILPRILKSSKMPIYRRKLSARYLQADHLVNLLKRWFGDGNFTWETVDDEILVIELLNPNAQLTKEQIDTIERTCYD
ncbi:hypothetical protein EYR41_011215 [Orbilia oligospora]|uniref:Uncharacterized protein n=1 Tax=Orbilia oligospora TaxID=2813651 RepID=A0A8H2DQZ6_ORBOL|nr:hypothetical protein EYR41_011215 [Orbilia oligospora]